MKGLTKEQIELMEQGLEAVRLAKEDAAGKRNVEGVITCPRCGDDCAYVIHHNGHCHGCCATPNCLRWCE